MENEKKTVKKFNRPHKSTPIVKNKVEEKKVEVTTNNNKPKKKINKTVSDNKPVEVVNKPKPKKKKDDHLIPLNDDIKIYSLGGLGVVGMNMYCIEQNDEILIIDAGILFADDDVHGVNYIIPDFTYLEKNQERIIGLFITHGHEDHIGAIPFLLQKVNIPTIYANGLAIGLIHNKMMEFPSVKYNITEFKDDSLIKFKNFQVSFFRTNHSIPDSFGIAIKTKYGYVVNTGDFKFDFTPLGYKPDYYKMTKLGEEGVFCLLSESTNADIPQFSQSERKIGENLSSLFHQINGRIIVATFASNVYRVRQILEASIECGRPIIVFGHSMEQTITIASRLKYINVPREWVHYARELKRIDDNEHVTILCTGSQGEPLAALSRIANGTHKQIKLLPNDTIIYSSKPIPGNEELINRNINKLVHAGAHVIKNSPLTDTHTTGHGSQNELRMMLSFMRPKYFVPVHGEYSMLKQHVEIAQELGVKKENCFVMSSGDVLTLNNKKAVVSKHLLPVNDIYLDQQLSDVDSNVLKERKKMADDGLVCVTFFVNEKLELIDEPIIDTRGYATPSKIGAIQNTIKQKVQYFYTNLTKNKKLTSEQLEKQVSNQLAQAIFNSMDRKPLISVFIKVVKR